MKPTTLAFAAAALLALASWTGGCAHSELDRKIDAKMAQEPAPQHRSDLAAEAATEIQRIPDLSPEQKFALTELRERTQATLNRLSDDSLKLRGLLIREVASSNYDPNEVDRIKTRIKNNANRRLGVIFDGVDQVNSILGRQALDHREILDSFMYESHSVRLD